MKVNNLDTEYIKTTLSSKALVCNLSLLKLLNYLFNESCDKSYAFNDIVYHCDYIINSKDEFLSLPIETHETSSKDNTSFDSWEEMIGDTLAEYLERQLGN